ncbi:DUF1059 domain-containing protein [Arthrobacter sp. Hz1]
MFAVEYKGFSVKSFACGDVIPGCDARWVCSAGDEIPVNVGAHAASVHGLVDLPGDLIFSVRRSIWMVS